MGADAIFLPAVISLGIVSSLQDFRVRRISNLWIIISLAYAITAHIVLFVSGNQQEIIWFPRSLVNMLASALVAIYFWKQNWWGGGDAKLFVCYSALVPLSQYPFGYFSYYFASFLLLFLTFVPAALWTFLHAQFNLAKAGKSIIDNFRPSKTRYWEFFQLSVGFTVIFFLSFLFKLALKQYFNWINDFPVLIWLITIVFYKPIFRFLKKRLWLALVSWALGICIIVFVPFFHQTTIGHVFIYSFASWLLIFILRLYIFRTIEYYVEWSKNNNMAFAGWMFLGALMIWFSKSLFHLK